MPVALSPFKLNRICVLIEQFLFAYTVKTASSEEFPLKEYIEERAVEIAEYIVETKATVRQTAKRFGVSKSTVHMVVIK
jgi:putative DeoR family transcriptional regulator (stage III sporulation protein D)